MRRPLTRKIDPLEKTKNEVMTMIHHRSWSAARQVHMVVLHAICHENVYGVQSSDLSGKEFMLAKVHANRIMVTHFQDSTEKMAEYIQWFWTREKGREIWRRKNNSDSTFRADWRVVFSDRSVCDYKLDLARQAEKMQVS